MTFHCESVMVALWSLVAASMLKLGDFSRAKSASAPFLETILALPSSGKSDWLASEETAGGITLTTVVSRSSEEQAAKKAETVRAYAKSSVFFISSCGKKCGVYNAFIVFPMPFPKGIAGRRVSMKMHICLQR